MKRLARLLFFVFALPALTAYAMSHVSVAAADSTDTYIGPTPFTAEAAARSSSVATVTDNLITLSLVDNLAGEAASRYSAAASSEVNPMEKNTFYRKIAHFITQPAVVTVLLSLGFLGIVIELFTPGFGIPGAIGTAAFFLFFYGHYLAGEASWGAVAVFATGILLLFLEIFVPGGILGILGVAGAIGGLIMAAGSFAVISVSLAIAFAVTVIGGMLFYRIFGYRGPFKKLVLFDSASKEKGYVASPVKPELTGRIAISLTPLRPSGTAELDGDYLDVVTEGAFVSKGKAVRIIKVQGGRIVVRETKED